MKKCLGLRAREVPECHKQSLMGHSGECMGDQNSYENSAEAQTYEGNKGFLGNWTGGHCVTSCSCPEILSETEFSCNNLAMNLALGKIGKVPLGKTALMHTSRV